MPIRWQIDRGFTIAAGDTQYWYWEWWSDAGQQNGPNKGRALPKGPAQGGNNTAKNVLVIFDFAKCRGGPGDPSAPEVFFDLCKLNGFNASGCSL
jgi:hypothetical protein